MRDFLDFVEDNQVLSVMALVLLLLFLKAVIHETLESIMRLVLILTQLGCKLRLLDTTP